jgi:hypothetical protein
MTKWITGMIRERLTQIAHEEDNSFAGVTTMY